MHTKNNNKTRVAKFANHTARRLYGLIAIQTKPTEGEQRLELERSERAEVPRHRPRQRWAPRKSAAHFLQQRVFKLTKEITSGDDIQEVKGGMLHFHKAQRISANKWLSSNANRQRR